MESAPTTSNNDRGPSKRNHNKQSSALAIGKKIDLVSLTDLFKQAQVRGLTSGKRNPSDWSKEAGAEFIDFVAENLHTRKSGIYKSSKARADRGGGTFAHKQIALAYAKYLSPELHMEVNDVFMKVQTASPEIADSIVDRMSQEELNRHIARAAGIATRKEFAGKLAARGVTGQGFSDCTNALYVPLFKGTAKELRAARKLPAKANVLASMQTRDLVTIAFTELVAGDRIAAENVFGNNACVYVCNKAAQAVANQLTVAGRRYKGNP